MDDGTQSQLNIQAQREAIEHAIKQAEQQIIQERKEKRK